MINIHSPYVKSDEKKSEAKQRLPSYAHLHVSVWITIHDKQGIPTALPIILVSVADGGICNFLLIFLISLVPHYHCSGGALPDNVP